MWCTTKTRNVTKLDVECLPWLATIQLLLKQYEPWFLLHCESMNANGLGHFRSHFVHANTVHRFTMSQEPHSITHDIAGNYCSNMGSSKRHKTPSGLRVCHNCAPWMQCELHKCSWCRSTAEPRIWYCIDSTVFLVGRASVFCPASTSATACMTREQQICTNELLGVLKHQMDRLD